MLFHKSAIGTLGPLAAATLVQRDNAFCYVELFTAKPMVVFAIVTTEHLGQMPIRSANQPFDKIKKTSCDIKPWCSELVPVIRWPIPKIQAGMLCGPDALAYGPIKVTASADDTKPSIRIFKFDYQTEQMLFDY